MTYSLNNSLIEKRGYWSQNQLNGLGGKILILREGGAISKGVDIFSEGGGRLVFWWISHKLKKTQCVPSQCVINEWGLNYGPVSNLASIYEFLCEKMFQFFAFYFYYCLFSMSFYYITKEGLKKKLYWGGRGMGGARFVQFLITRILQKTNKMIIMKMLEPVFTSYYKTYALKPWKIQLWVRIFQTEK